MAKKPKVLTEKKPIPDVTSRVDKLEDKAAATSTDSLTPTTTAEQDINTASQRQINLIWEWSQAVIALLVVFGNVLTASWLALTASTSEFPVVLSSALFLVIGFYFSRTNHQAVGGIGPKRADDQPYEGR